MKFIGILFVFIAVASAVEQIIFKLPQEVVDRIYKYALPCAKEFNIDTKLIPKVSTAMLPRDDATNNFLRCFTISAGYATEDGHMVVDKLVNTMNDYPRKEEVRIALNKCNEMTKETPMATLIAMHDCFAQAPPVRFLLE